MANFEDCPNCDSAETSWTEPGVKTCQKCAHQWDVATGKAVG